MLKSCRQYACICLGIYVAQEGLRTVETTSCGGIVIFHGKILLLYKNYRNCHEGRVFPKGVVETGESFETTVFHEVKEETGVSVRIAEYIGESEYTSNVQAEQADKSAHWCLMNAESYYSKPQREEFLIDPGYYKYHEVWHLLKFADEEAMLEKAYARYQERKRNRISESD